MGTDLLFYEGSDGYAEYYTVSEGNIALKRQELGWTSNWTHVVNGRLTGLGLTDLIFYDTVSGTVQHGIVATTADGVGATLLKQRIVGWRPGYTLLVPGAFTTGPDTVEWWLLCYDPAQGVGDFYVVGEDTSFNLVTRYTGWRSSWTAIVPGEFGGSAGTDLLFYSAPEATFEFYALDSSSMSLLTNDHNFPRDFSIIVPGRFGGQGSTDLLFYAPGRGDFYSVEQGSMTLLSSTEGWRDDWSEIRAGTFSAGSHSDLLFYEAASGTGEFYQTANGQLSRLLTTTTGWRTSWTHVLAGTFTSTLTSTNPTLLAGIEAFEPGSDYKKLHITGSGFLADELVSITITIVTQDGGPQTETIAQTAQANSTGHLSVDYSGSGGGVCDSRPRSFSVLGTGQSSHRHSTTAQAWCP